MKVTEMLTPQVDREDADITAWDSGCPDLSEHNSRDCAALVSITAKDEEEKQLAARYRDLPCMLPVEEILVAPICQRGGLIAGSTTAGSSTETTTETLRCPDGWETYTGAGSPTKCFKLSSDTEYATNAEENCQALGGHLASIHSIEEHNFIAQMADGSGAGFWVGGVDLHHNGVWGWTDGSGFDFSNWSSSQPDGGEYYMLVASVAYDRPYDWRDWEYDHSLRYICQLIL